MAFDIIKPEELGLAFRGVSAALGRACGKCDSGEMD